MTKKLISLFLAFTLLLAIAPTAFAAEEGRTLQDPINVIFGQEYTRTWTKDTDHLYWYNKITVEEQGILDMTFTKPYDSEGEIGRLQLALYDEQTNTVWDSSCYYSREIASLTYDFKVGIPAGVYYLLIKPGFVVSSGIISSTYHFGFTPDAYCELEPNEAIATATAMELNQMYTGYYGQDGGSADDNDYYRVSLTAGETYRITRDWSKLSPTTALFKFFDANGERVRLSFNKVDANGYEYCEYTPEVTGTYVLQIYNYHQRQLEYKVGLFQGVHNYSSDWTYNETSHWHACVDEGYTDLKKDEGAHTMDAGTVTASATCTENGTTVYKCTVCGMTQEKTIQKLGHSWSDWQPITDATGLVTVGKQRTCATCGKVEKQTSSGAGQFVDVSESSFYATPVAWAVEQGITNGTDKTHFSPESPCTRGQVVTFLWRAAGEPAPQSGNNPFADVKESDYFYTAVIWAVENGITTGTSSTKFSPNEPCTRGQVVTFQYRSNNEPEVNGKCDFTDVKSSDYFYNAVLWAVANGITNGTSAKTFSPQATCTRGQIVTFLFRDFSK